MNSRANPAIRSLHVNENSTLEFNSMEEVISSAAKFGFEIGDTVMVKGLLGIDYITLKSNNEGGFGVEQPGIGWWVRGEIQGYALNKFGRIENTIEELVNNGRKYKVGDVVELLGYYSAGDGAGHKRKIEETDDGSGVQLANGLWANIVHNGEVKSSWFGAFSRNSTDFKVHEFRVFANYYLTTPNISVCVDKEVFLNDTIEVISEFGTNRTFKYKKFTSSSKINFTFQENSGKRGLVFQLKHLKGTTGWYIDNYMVWENLVINSTNATETLTFETVGGSNASTIQRCEFNNITISSSVGKSLVFRGGVFECNLNQPKCSGGGISPNDINIYVTTLEGEQQPSSFIINEPILWNKYYGIFTTNEGNIYQADVTSINSPSIFRPYSSYIRLRNSANTKIRSFHGEFAGKDNPNKVIGIDIVGCVSIDTIEGGGHNLSSLVRIFNNGGASYLDLKNTRGLYDSMDYALLHVGGSSSYYVDCPDRANIEFSNNFRGTVHANTIGGEYHLDCRHLEWARVISSETVITGGITYKRFPSRGQYDAIKIDKLGNSYYSYNCNREIEFDITTLQFRPLGVTYTTEPTSDPTRQKIAFLGATPVGKRHLHPAITDSEKISKLSSLFFDLGLTYDWYDISVQSLDTPYYATKMQQEGVYEDFVAYMDLKLEYDNQQRELETQRQQAFTESGMDNYDEWLATQPMMLPSDSEPIPSENLMEFKKKYLG